MPHCNGTLKGITEAIAIMEQSTEGLSMEDSGTEVQVAKTVAKTVKKRPRRVRLTTKKKLRKSRKTSSTVTAPGNSTTPQVQVATMPTNQGEDDVSVLAQEVSVSAQAGSATRSHTNQQVAGQPDGEYQVTETVAVRHDPARPPHPTVSSLDSAGRRMYSTNDLRAQRMGVYYFDFLFGSPPESPEAWGGRSGLVAKIRDSLLLPKTASLPAIWKTVQVIRSYQEQKKQYKGEEELLVTHP